MIRIERIRDTGTQTLGRGIAYAENLVEKPFEFVTLEPTWMLNQPYASCVPTDIYEAVKHTSPSFGDCILLLDVPGRSHILFHPLNYFSQTEGCVGVGRRFKHLDKNNQIDVVDSKKTMKKILSLLPQSFKVEIKNVKGFQRAYTTNE